MAGEAEDLAARLRPNFRTRCAAGSWWPTTSPRSSSPPAACPDLPTLLAHADAAMYEAKRAGGGCWRLYEDTEQAAALSP